ncbi:uncharacterized protein LOC112577047 isoform X2 [Pomacea canaliculata]|uniref:uncharacterized protein LOC112577047 isoform X2 n=1 Tax=Pomacea canaliculata TaxID=400727 RepID=UPI000D735F5B|nr:uncharacterized protein LOC112577047 isoform X2 [Pomacea canaliculata]
MVSDEDCKLIQTSIDEKAETPVQMTYTPPPGYYPGPQVQSDSRPVTSTPQLAGIQSNHFNLSRNPVDMTRPVGFVARPGTLVKKQERTRDTTNNYWAVFGFAVCIFFVLLISL